MPALTDDAPSELFVRPRAVVVTAVVLSAVSFVVGLGGWFAFPRDIREQFDALQIGTLIVFLVFIIGFMGVLGTCTLRADADGVQVRNGWITRAWTWEEISGIRYRPGDPWAFILTGPESRANRHQVLAIQSADGQRAKSHAAQLLAMARTYSPPQN